MGIHPRKLKCRPGLAMVTITLVLGILLFFFVYSFSDNGKLQTATRKNETTQDVIAVHTDVFWLGELPICQGNLLDAREFHYEKETNGFFDSNRLVSETGPCRLRRYTVQHAVTCFDGLLSNQERFPQTGTDTDLIRSRHQELRFVFMGDSRMRQQFLNFIKLIPEYDNELHPYPIPYHHHGDIEFASHILKVRVSFKWHPLLNNNLMKTVRQWTTTDPSKRPYWIVLSMTVWHMLIEHGADYQLYQNKLSEFGPLLSQLANMSHIIWLHQYPSLDFYGGIRASNTAVVTEKIYNYNKITRQILESLHSRIRIWDSSNSLVEEYVRGCTVLKRDERAKKKDPAGPHYAYAYFNCDDYVHTGYSALSQATQLLFNDICNSQVE